MMTKERIPQRYRPKRTMPERKTGLVRRPQGLRDIVSWTQEPHPDASRNFIRELALSHAREGGQQGFQIAALIERGDFSGLCRYELDYSEISVHQAVNARQALAFYSKCNYIDLKIDKSQVAYDKFMESEEQCRETNRIFRLHEEGLFSFGPRVDAILHRAQRKIARVLGDIPSLSDLKLRFGPGATTLTKKKNASVVEKLQAGHSCSEDLLPIVKAILEQVPGLLEIGFTPVGEEPDALVGQVTVHVTNGRLDFVRKNAKTDRSIVVEGSLNTLIQLAIGDEMKRRLARVGIDISDQSINRRLALEGSLTGLLATLDLSSASDTIAIALVAYLLPFDWYVLLSHCRSGKVDYKGKEMVLEKFSSMGNGFTFPLETLIFWALSSSVRESDGFASVYGDDIIVRTSDVEDVKNILHVCGFTVNRDKSFWSGPFRESCGGDYLSGIDIRPYYHKELCSPAELFKLHNFYVRHLDVDRANLVRDQINPTLRLYGPDGYGDGHLLGAWVPKFSNKRNTHGYAGATFDTFSLCGRFDVRQKRPGDRVLPSYSIYICEDEVDPLLVPIAEKVREYCRSERTCLRFEPGSDRLSPGIIRVLRAADITVPRNPLRERRSPADGGFYKEVALPGTFEYKRVSIYTFDIGR